MDTSNWVKIQIAAKELGVTVKTIYNWISDSRLKMVRPGFVDMIDAWEVYMHQKTKRVEISYFMSAYGIKRDSYGRFTKDGE